MEQGASTKTAQINAYEFTQYFETFLSEGKDVLHICLSSGITGVLNAAARWQKTSWKINIQIDQFIL